MKNKVKNADSRESLNIKSLLPEYKNRNGADMGNWTCDTNVPRNNSQKTTAFNIG